MQGKAKQGKANCMQKVDFTTFSLFRNIALVVIFRIDSNHNGWLRLSKFYACYVDPYKIKKIREASVDLETSVL